MRSTRLALAGTVTAAVLSLGTAFAVPALALPGDDPNCPEGSQKTCTQEPPRECPAGTVPTPVQPAAGEGTTCTLDSLIKARAKADVLTKDQLVKLCAEAHVRHLVNVRIAVGHPKWEIITLDDKTCSPPKAVPAPGTGSTNNPCSCTTTPAPAPSDNTATGDSPPLGATAPVPLPQAPAPVTVNSNLPVTH